MDSFWEETREEMEQRGWEAKEALHERREFLGRGHQDHHW